MSQLKKRLTLTDLLTRDEVLEGLSTKDLLLAQGVRLFHRYGGHGTSIGKLLEATAKSKSQFYFHFADKDDFICRVLDLEMTTMIKMSQRQPLDSLEDFSNWFSPYLELAELPGNLGCPVGPLATEMSPANEAIREESERQFRRWEDCLAAALQNLALKERFGADYCARKAARSLACGLQGAFLLGRVFQKNQFVAEVGENFYRELKNWKELRPSL